MNDKTLLLVTAAMAAASLILSTYSVVKTESQPTTSLAVVDAKAVMEAKKLVLLASLKGRDRDMAHLQATIAASQSLPAAFDEALTTLARRHHVTLIDKAALVKGEAIPDLTDELYRLMDVSAQDAGAARNTISRETFGQ